MIVVQRIVICWTKKSRGMPGAAARNAVPQALPLAALNLGKITVHEITANEDQDFFLEHKTFGIQAPMNSDWALSFNEEEGRLAVYLDMKVEYFGHPMRNQFPRQIFSLKSGETASVHVNGRSDYQGRSYKQFYINIGYGELEKNIFVEKKADYFLDKTANLL